MTRWPKWRTGSARSRRRTTPVSTPRDVAADDSAAFFGDTESYVGQQVTVSAEVSELITTTDVGSALRIAGDEGEPTAVVSATPPPQLDQSDIVQVSGTVMTVQRDSFEAEFGVAADELFEGADAWFEEVEGQIAVSAQRMEVLQSSLTVDVRQVIDPRGGMTGTRCPPRRGALPGTVLIPGSDARRFLSLACGSATVRGGTVGKVLVRRPVPTRPFLLYGDGRWRPAPPSPEPDGSAGARPLGSPRRPPAWRTAPRRRRTTGCRR